MQKKSINKDLSCCFSYTEMIVLGGMNGPWQMRLVEKYDADGNMIETLPNLITGR